MNGVRLRSDRLATLEVSHSRSSLRMPVRNYQSIAVEAHLSKSFGNIVGIIDADDPIAATECGTLGSLCRRRQPGEPQWIDRMPCSAIRA